MADQVILPEEEGSEEAPVVDLAVEAASAAVALVAVLEVALVEDLAADTAAVARRRRRTIAGR